MKDVMISLKQTIWSRSSEKLPPANSVIQWRHSAGNAGLGFFDGKKLVHTWNVTGNYTENVDNFHSWKLIVRVDI